MSTTTVEDAFRNRRAILQLSQSRLARISGVSRFKICRFELSGGSLTPDEQQRIALAIAGEVARLQTITAAVDSNPAPTEGK